MPSAKLTIYISKHISVGNLALKLNLVRGNFIAVSDKNQNCTALQSYSKATTVFPCSNVFSESYCACKVIYQVSATHAGLKCEEKAEKFHNL